MVRDTVCLFVHLFGGFSFGFLGGFFGVVVLVVYLFIQFGGFCLLILSGLSQFR